MAADLICKEMLLLDDMAYRAKPIETSQIWAAAHNGRRLLPWSTESDIQGYVKQALDDCICAAGLDEHLRLSNELSVDDMRPDLWVLHLHKKDGAALNLPVGIGEVKKPKRISKFAGYSADSSIDSLPLHALSLLPPSCVAVPVTPPHRSPRLAAAAASALCAATVAAVASASSCSASTSSPPPSSVAVGGLEKATLLGQIFDYMCLLRAQYGLRFVFGILSNYSEWRIVWLPDTQCAAEATCLPFSPAAPADPDLPTRRELHGTRVFSCSDPSLIQQLVSMLHKMANSPHVQSPSLLHIDRPYYTAGELPPYSWQHLKPQFSLRLLSPIHANSSRFHLVQDYRGGADGRVWLVAAESSGSLGVIKFPSRLSDSLAHSSLESEAQAWREIWDCATARVITLAGQRALLMPFAFHAQRQSDSSVRFLNPDHQHPDRPAADYLDDVDHAELLSIISAADSDPLAVAREAVVAIADRQHEHTDMHWRHIAFLIFRDGISQKLRRQAILIDLTRVQRLPSLEANVKREAIRRMMCPLLASPPVNR
jgi:hypothetical protein